MAETEGLGRVTGCIFPSIPSSMVEAYLSDAMRARLSAVTPEDLAYHDLLTVEDMPNVVGRPAPRRVNVDKVTRADTALRERLQAHTNLQRETPDQRATLTTRARRACFLDLLPIPEDLTRELRELLPDLEHGDLRVDPFGSVVAFKAPSSGLFAFHADHIFPWAFGGRTSSHNLMAVHASTNCSRQHRFLGTLLLLSQSADSKRLANEGGGEGGGLPDENQHGLARGLPVRFLRDLVGALKRTGTNARREAADLLDMVLWGPFPAHYRPEGSSLSDVLGQLERMRSRRFIEYLQDLQSIRRAADAKPPPEGVALGTHIVIRKDFKLHARASNALRYSQSTGAVMVVDETAPQLKASFLWPPPPEARTVSRPVKIPPDSFLIVARAAPAAPPSPPLEEEEDEEDEEEEEPATPPLPPEEPNSGAGAGAEPQWIVGDIVRVREDCDLPKRAPIPLYYARLSRAPLEVVSTSPLAVRLSEPPVKGAPGTQAIVEVLDEWLEVGPTPRPVAADPRRHDEEEEEEEEEGQRQDDEWMRLSVGCSVQ